MQTSDQDSFRQCQAVVNFSDQGGAKSLAAEREVELILCWAELNVPALFPVHISGVDDWQSYYLSHQ